MEEEGRGRQCEGWSEVKSGHPQFWGHCRCLSVQTDKNMEEEGRGRQCEG